jgi:hypothetical protein
MNMPHRYTPRHPQPALHGMGSDPFTVTVSTPSTNSAPVDTSSPLVMLLLGAALGAGVVTLIFTWK